MNRYRYRYLIAAMIVAAVALFTVTACGSSDDTGDTGGAAQTGDTAASGGDDAGAADLEAAKQETDAAYKGRFTEPPSGPNPAVKNKKIWLISTGQASLNAQLLTGASLKAAKALGWDVRIYDAKFLPENYAKGIDQAIAAGADAIALVAIDCPQAKAALERAKAAKVIVAAMLSFDCDEATPGEEPLFGASPSLGDRYKSWKDAFEQWGADTAAYAIAKQEGKANVLNFQNNEFLILRYLQDGFDARLEKCPGCKNNAVNWTLSELGPKLAAKVQASFLRTPDANALMADANPTIGFTNGVVQANRQSDTTVVSGLGVAPDMDSIRDGSGLTAVPAWPQDWWAWATFDTINSLFNETPVRDSGLGWQMVDKDHNLPPKGQPYQVPIDYEAAYKKSWGVQ